MSTRRRRHRTGGHSLSLLLFGVTLFVVVLGVFLTLFAVSLASMFGSAEGSAGAQFVGKILATPLVGLFEGGLLTVGLGVVLMVVSAIALVTSA